jgi:arylsulfatase A-like enzyme
MAHQLIHGYYACVSYTDAQIGKLIQALEDFDLAKNTIVVLWGDHGWQLGEHTLWCKHSNFKTSLNTPLIISAPGYNGDQKTEALVEFVDIFPSLCELTGLDQPAQLQGKSFVPLMINPQMHWKEAVYSRFIQGESVKTSQYLFTEWYDNNGKIYSDMLYDHLSDPSENLNISGEVSLADTVRKLQEMLNIQILKSREIQLDRISKNKIP